VIKSPSQQSLRVPDLRNRSCACFALVRGNLPLSAW